MNLPLSGSAIVDLDNQRWLLQGDHLQRLADDERVDGAQVHFTDFGGAIQGVEQVAAARRYAAAIIEKNLRDRGESESTSKVLLLDSRSRSGATRALYNAVPSDTYERYSNRVGEHDDHMLLVPYLSLLLKRGKIEREPVSCVLFQHDLHIDLLVLVDDSAYAFVRVTASGSSEMEWQRALRYLIEEIDLLRNRLDQRIEKAVFINWDPEDLVDADQVCDWLESHAGLAVSREDQHEMSLDGQPVRSSLPGLFRLFNGRMVASPSPSLPLYLAERILPVAAVLIAGVGLALFALAWQWQAQVRMYETQYQELLDSSQRIDLAEVHDQLQRAAETGLTPGELAFVNQTWRVGSRPSLTEVLADVREILPANVYLSTASFGGRRDSEVFRIEGWIESDMAGVNASMERLINALSVRGYDVQANNLRGHMRRNLFQLDIDLGEVSREI